MSRSNLPIGIFDSGVGGLTVMRAVADRLPNENLIYLGDTARVPYGNRGPATVRKYACNATSMLVGEGIKALVVACNTASAYAVDALRIQFQLPIIGVVKPVARVASRTTKTGTVGVIGTRGTVASDCYRESLHRLGVARVIQQACPLFVPLAEEGWLKGEVVDAVARHYLSAFEDSDLDTLILGCTHYPLLVAPVGRCINDLLGRQVKLLDSASATAAALEETLMSEKLQRATARSTIRFCATDDPAHFRETAHRFFGGELGDVEHVDIVDVSLDEEQR